MKHVFIIIKISLLLINSTSNAFAYNSLTNSVPQFPDKKAEFPGGDIALMMFIIDHVKINNLKDFPLEQVIIQFEITEKGRLKQPLVLKGGNTNFNKELIKTLKKSPHWEPAIKNGSVTKSKVILPFHLHPKH